MVGRQVADTLSGPLGFDEIRTRRVVALENVALHSEFPRLSLRDMISRSK
jgi:hypothetical protein